MTSRQNRWKDVSCRCSCPQRDTYLAIFLYAHHLCGSRLPEGLGLVNIGKSARSDESAELDGREETTGGENVESLAEGNKQATSFATILLGRLR